MSAYSNKFIEDMIGVLSEITCTDIAIIRNMVNSDKDELLRYIGKNLCIVAEKLSPICSIKDIMYELKLIVNTMYTVKTKDVFYVPNIATKLQVSHCIEPELQKFITDRILINFVYKSRLQNSITGFIEIYPSNKNYVSTFFDDKIFEVFTINVYIDDDRLKISGNNIDCSSLAYRLHLMSDGYPIYEVPKSNIFMQNNITGCYDVMSKDDKSERGFLKMHNVISYMDIFEYPSHLFIYGLINHTLNMYTHKELIHKSSSNVHRAYERNKVYILKGSEFVSLYDI